jgi:hypothetical protein
MNSASHVVWKVMASVNTSGALALSSAARNQANPSATKIAPKRDSGRRRHAYRPVAM